MGCGASSPVPALAPELSEPGSGLAAALFSKVKQEERPSRPSKLERASTIKNPDGTARKAGSLRVPDSAASLLGLPPLSPRVSPGANDMRSTPMGMRKSLLAPINTAGGTPISALRTSPLPSVGSPQSPIPTSGASLTVPALNQPGSVTGGLTLHANKLLVNALDPTSPLPQRLSNGPAISAPNSSTELTALLSRASGAPHSHLPALSQTAAKPPLPQGALGQLSPKPSVDDVKTSSRPSPVVQRLAQLSGEAAAGSKWQLGGKTPSPTKLNVDAERPSGTSDLARAGVKFSFSQPMSPTPSKTAEASALAASAGQLQSAMRGTRCDSNSSRGTFNNSINPGRNSNNSHASHVRFVTEAERAPVNVPANGSFGYEVDLSEEDIGQDVDVCDGSDDSCSAAGRSAGSSVANPTSKPVSATSSVSHSGPSSTGFRIAAVTGADLMNRALQKGLGGSIRRHTHSDDGAKAPPSPGAPVEAAPAYRLDKPSLRARPVSAAAVSLAFLLDFAARLDPSLSTLDVVYKIIVPETSQYCCRYADYIPDEHLGIPNFFISHRWASPFNALVNSLFCHFDLTHSLTNGDLDPSKIFLWLDIFAVNQHPGEAQTCDLAGLQAALGAARQGTLLCLDEQGLVLTRIWCLYEIHHTIRLKGTQGLRVLAADVQFAELKGIFQSLDASRAQATVEADRQRILDDIQATTGIEKLNRGIKEALVGSCVLEAQATASRRAQEPSAFVAAHIKAGQMLRVAGRYADAGSALKAAMEVYDSGLCFRDKHCAVCNISLGTLMQEEGKLAEAERFCRAGLQLSDELFKETVERYKNGGEEKPGSDATVTDVMTANSALASVLQAAGQLQEALVYCDKALATCRNVRGEKHPDTATAMTSKAGLLQALGRSHDALKLLREVQALREKHLGTDHPLTAGAYEALGSVLQHRGEFEEADQLFTKALEVRRHALGPEHPAVGSSLHALAALRAEQNRFEDAESLYLQAMELRQKAFGPGHPSYAATLNNLAALYQETGREDQAVPLLKGALEARTQALGREHPATANTLNNLATLLLDRGHVEAAQPLYLEHIRVLEKVLGAASDKHADMALALENYATCLKAAGQLDTAITYVKKAMEIYERLGGSCSADVAAAAANLGGLLQTQGCLKEATQQYERALAIRRMVHGEQHSTQVVLLHALGCIAQKQGRLQEAEKQLKAAVNMRRILTVESASAESSRSQTPLITPTMSTTAMQLTLMSASMTAQPPILTAPGGSVMDWTAALTAPAVRTKSVLQSRPSNRSTASVARRAEADLQLALSLNELGNVQQDLEKFEDAQDSYQEALELREELLGPEAEEAAICRENLGCVLLELGRAKEAEPLLRHSLQVNLVLTNPGSKAAAALSSYNLGRALEAQGSTEARDAYERALRLAEAELGPHHDDTIQYRENLEGYVATQEAANKPKSAKRGRK